LSLLESRGKARMSGGVWGTPLTERENWKKGNRVIPRTRKELRSAKRRLGRGGPQKNGGEGGRKLFYGNSGKTWFPEKGGYRTGGYSSTQLKVGGRKKKEASEKFGLFQGGLLNKRGSRKVASCISERDSEGGMFSLSYYYRPTRDGSCEGKEVELVESTGGSVKGKEGASSVDMVGGKRSARN